MEPMVNIALRAARLAGQVIVKGFDRPDLVKISEKGHHDLVTNIDTEAEQIIIDTLTDKYPNHRMTGEESGSHGHDGADYEWVIDPLDGTMNFVHRIPHFCVSIACIHKGRLQHAVILDPMRTEEFTASRGQGARLNGKRMRVSEVETIHGAVVATSGQGKPEHADSRANVMRHLMADQSIMRQPGSAALELAYIAAGRIDALWMQGLSPWDMAAGALLVTEAGGRLGDFDGGVNYMQTGDLVAGTPRCFRLLTALVKKHLR